VGKNTCEIPIQIFYVGLGASIFTCVNMRRKVWIIADDGSI
jgi:hypothetical protein